jgi:Bacterial SH3 domain
MIRCITALLILLGSLFCYARLSLAQTPSPPSTAATFYEARYQLAGFLLRAGAVCEQEGQRTITAGLRLLGTSELKAISRNFPDTTRQWMTAGAEKFNTGVMNDGVADACAFAMTVRQKAEETAQADHTSDPAQSAGNRCRVTDPTSTPLNVRTNPNGRIVGTVANGVLVTVLDRSVDKRGKQWIYVAEYSSGKPIGWVFKKFISCF